MTSTTKQMWPNGKGCVGLTHYRYRNRCHLTTQRCERNAEPKTHFTIVLLLLYLQWLKENLVTNSFFNPIPMTT